VNAPNIAGSPFQFPQHGRFEVGGVPDGRDAQLVAALAQAQPGGVLHIAVDDLRMTRLAEALAFFAPGLKVIAFPAWDCLPYDRASPHRDILARRIEALTALAAIGEGPAPVVLTTISAVLQRVPPPATFQAAGLDLRPGLQIGQAAVVDYLLGNGYSRAGTVGEAGEFAVRGGIVDLFPPGTVYPLRIDFFGDEVEQLRLFDAL
jgi:transcription-repair coupling factor (superfamily II helicase)